jgi:two-component system sensor histidine kinase EvgS
VAVADSNHGSILPNLSAEERNWLQQNPEKLILLYNPDFPPIEYAGPNGGFEGLGADVIAKVEERLNIAFVKRPCDDWNHHLAQLEKGECAVAPTIVRTPERERFAFFTSPYATVPVVIISQRDMRKDISLESLTRRRIAVVAGFATEQYVRDRMDGQSEIVVVQTVSEGLREVSFGQVDAFVENLAVAAYHIGKDGLPNLRVAGTTDYSFAWSIGISRKYPLLFSSVQKALESIPQKEIDDVRDHWISLESQHRLDPETILMLKMGGSFVFLLLLSLAGITFFLKRQLNEKIATLNQSRQELIEQTERLRESEERFRNLFQTIPQIAVQGYGTDGGIRYWNEASERLFGYSVAEAVRMNVFDLVAIPEERDNIRKWVGEMIQTRRPVSATEVSMRRKDGSEVVVFSSHAVVEVPGREPDFYCVGVDLTKRKELEVQLQQAQKMESVGMLAGGVAHDFNNMLQAILGYSELAMIRMDPEHPAWKDLQEIRMVAKRSVDLTKQLLAFARKQTSAPRILDLNQTLEGMLQMLQRLIGEEINLKWIPGTDLRPIRIDPAQMDQILANLCVNARDAIGRAGGTIAIETTNVMVDKHRRRDEQGIVPGAYAVLSVRDDGCGMDATTLHHIFDPFFTTKGVGKGTGLGLSIVYGIVRQNHGFIDVESSPDKGTTFRLHFPVHAGKDVSIPHAETASPTDGGCETILLVEDEIMILHMVQAMLERKGYTIITANTPADAIRIATEHKNDIHLLVTDVIMPGMNGKELATRLQANRPGLKCLFMSGYPSDVIAHHGILEEGINFIQKPFSMNEISTKIADVLIGVKKTVEAKA